MKHSISIKLLASLLALVMIAAFVPAFTLLAADTDAPAYEEAPEELKAENGNLAIGATPISQFNTHYDEVNKWDVSLLNDGEMNTVDNANGGYHPDINALNKYNQPIFQRNHTEWVGFDFGEAKTFDTVVIYPARDKDGVCYGMPNAFAIEASMDGDSYKTLYEVYDYDVPAFGPQTFQFEAVTAQYVRVVALSVNKDMNGNWAMKLCELAVYDKDYTPSLEGYCPNLLLDAAVESSAFHQDLPVWSLNYINDGDRYNLVDSAFNYGQLAGWHTGTTAPMTEDAYLTFDLGKKTEFDKFVLWPGTSIFETGNYDLFLPLSLTIQISDDNLTWTDVTTITEMPTVWEPIEITFEAKEAQYVRAYMTRSNHLKLSEMELYNTKDTVMPEKPDDTVQITPNVNLALDATVIYSSITAAAGWEIGKLNNGETMELTGGFTTGKSSTEWVGYEFARPTMVNKIVLYSAYSAAGDDFDVWSGIPHSFKVQYTVDGLAWHDLATYACEVPPMEEEAVEVTFDATVVKMIRVWSDDMYPKPSDGSFTYIQLAEMEVWYTAEDDGQLSTDKEFGTYMQVRDAADGKQDLRIVLIANLAKLASVNSVDVTISLTLESGSELALPTKKLATENSDYELYKNITAGDDTYTAKDGFALFGDVITGIPVGAYTAVNVTITESGTENASMSFES